MANKKTDMKDRIIASAFTLFSVYGFSATTIEQIIEKAGCSKGTFYHYFPGKASILRSWIDVMDMDYQKWYEECDKELPALEQLGLFNDYILSKLENFADLETLSTIYAFPAEPRGRPAVLENQPAVKHGALCNLKIRTAAGRDPQRHLLC